MERKKYAYFKQDVKDLISSFNEYDDPIAKRDFLRWIDACAEYTMAVVKHVAFHKSGASVPELEDLNRKRTSKHDNGISLTITLNRNIEKLTGLGASFAGLNGISYLKDIHRISDLSSEQRLNLGQLFFETSSIIASLTPKEVKETGLEQLKEEVGKDLETNRFKKDLKYETRRYGIKDIGSPSKDGFVRDADDCYDEIER